MIRFFLILLFPLPLLAKLQVMTSIPVEAYFIERIGGEQVAVSSLVSSTMCPECFSMTPSQVRLLSKAKLYFSTGFSFEEIILNKIAPSLPHLTVINLRQGIPMINFGAESAEPQAEVSDRRHRNHSARCGEKDPHIWTTPANVKIQATTILHALQLAEPKFADYFYANFEIFNSELTALNQYLRDRLSVLKDKSVFVYHPSYGYLAHQYGFKQVAIEIGGKSPTAKYLANIVERAKKEGIKVIIIEPQSDLRPAQVIAKAIGGEVLLLNINDANYFQNMRAIANALYKYYH